MTEAKPAAKELAALAAAADDDAIVDLVGLTADTLDRELPDMAAHLDGIEMELVRIRAKLREKVGEDLRQLAIQAAQLDRAQAQLIRRMTTWGYSSRTLGEMTNRSHHWVQQRQPSRSELDGALLLLNRSGFWTPYGAGGLVYSEMLMGMKLYLLTGDPEVHFDDGDALCRLGVMVPNPVIVGPDA